MSHISWQHGAAIAKLGSGLTASQLIVSRALAICARTFHARENNTLIFRSVTRMTPRSAAAVASNQLAAVHNPKEPCALAVAVPQKMARLLFGKSNHDCSTDGRRSNRSPGFLKGRLSPSPHLAFECRSFADGSDRKVRVTINHSQILNKESSGKFDGNAVDAWAAGSSFLLPRLVFE
jgi:hypothetical protein